MLGFDEPSLHKPLITTPTKIIDTDISATCAIELKKEGTFRATLQHATAVTISKLVLMPAAFVTTARKDLHHLSDPYVMNSKTLSACL